MRAGNGVRRMGVKSAVLLTLLATGLAVCAEAPSGIRGPLEVEVASGVKMRFCYCPPGRFTMGSSLSGPSRNQEGRPVHVTLSRGFWMGETEVTQAQWLAVMGSSPSYFSGGNHPVEQVSWEDACGMLERLNAAGRAPEGLRFALPTEAQWEYACRAGTGSEYVSGSVLSTREANFRIPGLGRVDPIWPSGETVAVKSYGPNPWGLYDMQGNVWEWCMDWHAARLQGGLDPNGSVAGTMRVSRGGSWSCGVEHCRASSRARFEPFLKVRDQGFRAVLVPLR